MKKLPLMQMGSAVALLAAMTLAQAQSVGVGVSSASQPGGAARAAATAGATTTPSTVTGTSGSAGVGGQASSSTLGVSGGSTFGGVASTPAGTFGAGNAVNQDALPANVITNPTIVTPSAGSVVLPNAAGPIDPRSPNAGVNVGPVGAPPAHGVGR